MRPGWVSELNVTTSFDGTSAVGSEEREILSEKQRIQKPQRKERTFIHFASSSTFIIRVSCGLNLVLGLCV